MAEKIKSRAKVKKDLTGQRFGRWTVLYEAEPRHTKSGKINRVWHCVCECGNEKDVQENGLIYGKTMSCGCLRDEKSKNRTQDLTGKVFGFWTVISRAESKWGVRWTCKCICGTIKDVNARRLLSGESKSCGCSTSHYLSKSLRGKRYKNNTYDLTSQSYGIGYTSKRNIPFYFDKEDYELINKYCWNIDDDGYICTRTYNEHITMSRLVTHAKDGDVVDHINHAKEDNRKSNLRITNAHMNAINKSPSKRNTSGYVGVYLNKKSNKWVAQIGFNYKVYSLGTYDSIEDAILARKIAEEKFFGEYSYDVSMKIAKHNKIKEYKE